MKIYEEIKKNGKEAFVDSISSNTKYSKLFVGQVYDYVFIEKHHLDHGVKNFPLDIDMAHSFQKLISGDYKPVDVLLLRHEHLEGTLVKRYNLTIRQAHAITDKKYSYQTLIIKGRDEK